MRSPSGVPDTGMRRQATEWRVLPPITWRASNSSVSSGCLIAYDRDEAGDRAAEKLAQQLMAQGLDCYRILFPKGLDANEYALKVGPAAKSLGVAIRSAQWLGKGEAR